MALVFHVILALTAVFAAQWDVSSSALSDAALNSQSEAPSTPPKEEKPALSPVPRAACGIILDVPEAQLDLGEVYHVIPGGDVQILATSRHPLYRMALTCRRVAGYVVAPFDLDRAKQPLLAGALSIPVRSILSGSEEIDDVLHGGAPAESAPEALAAEAFLDADRFPTIEVVLEKAVDASPIGKPGAPPAFQLTLVGQAWIKGRRHDFTVPAKLTAHRINFAYFMRNLGDGFVLETRFEVPKKLFFPENARGGPSTQFADTLDVDVFLLFSTVPPNKCLDPTITQAQYDAERKFESLLRDFGDPKAGYAFAKDYLSAHPGDADARSRLARFVLEGADVRHRDRPSARAWTESALQMSKSPSADLCDVLASIKAEAGDLKSAVEWGRKAMAAVGPSTDPSFAGAIQKRLSLLEMRAKEAGISIDVETPKEGKAKSQAGR